MSNYNTPYQAINCSFHDVLLEKATFGKVQNIQYMTPDQKKVVLDERIIDVYTKSGSEYMVLENRITIRLDHIIAVGDNKPNDFDDCEV